MSKITLNGISNVQNINSSATTVNNNNDVIVAAFDNTLSLDGTAPNQMQDVLDMNSMQILNLPQPATANSPLRLQDLDTFMHGGTISNIPVGGTAGQALVKNSSANFDTSWGAALAPNTVSNTVLAQAPAFTLKGNPAGSTANEQDISIPALTQKVAPAVADKIMIADSAASNALKYVTVSSITALGAVTSIASNTGDFTLAGGVTNTANQIQSDGNYFGWALPNIGITASVNTGILTVNLTDSQGNTPSTSSPIYINYRSATASTGTTTMVPQTSALSINTSATGASLGSAANTGFRLWLVTFNNSGANVLGLVKCATEFSVTSQPQIFSLNEGLVASSTAMSASSTAANTFYTQSAVTNKPFRILGYIEYNSTGLATPGTYATSPNFIQVFGPGIRRPGETVQTAIAINLAGNSGVSNTSFVAFSNTQFSTLTPTSAANLIKYNISCVALTGVVASTNTTVSAQVSRGSSTLIGSVQQGSSPSSSGGISWQGGLTFTGYDNPNTTSGIVYQLAGKSTGSGNSIGLVNVNGYVEEIQT